MLQGICRDSPVPDLLAVRFIRYHLLESVELVFEYPFGRRDIVGAVSYGIEIGHFKFAIDLLEMKESRVAAS